MEKGRSGQRLVNSVAVPYRGGGQIHSLTCWRETQPSGKGGGLAGLALFILGGHFLGRGWKEPTHIPQREKKTGDLEECVRKREKLDHVLKSKLEEAVFSKCMWAVDVANFLWVKSVIQR
ncbi:hypothetical protein ABG768_016470 [Culter alburnus]|uniref:Uncharacterized protein n=1 Tax=Culter alburnus TaxID=194366 RepID=A0AAW1Z0M9_CULAL